MCHAAKVRRGRGAGDPDIYPDIAGVSGGGPAGLPGDQ
jgi:hypothetical protein